MFTNDEYEKYLEIISYVNEIDKLDLSELVQDAVKKKELIAKRKIASSQLTQMIRMHKGFPRKVRLESVIFHRNNEEVPSGVTWQNLKLSKKIAEFESDMSRAMGLCTNEHTFDKIIVKWKNLDLLEQLVMDGFTMDLLIDGRIVQKKYRYFSSSAGQLRTDKCSFLSEDMWSQIKNRIECGLNWETINARGGVNVNKMLAYWSLCSSASIPWPEFNIDKTIVINDFEAEVTDRMLYIKPDYTTEDAIRTVVINHSDGAGMYIPGSEVIPKDVNGKNFMMRGPTFKGLLSPFSVLEFCKEHGVEPIIKDRWGKVWNIEKDDIQIIFTDSQFKCGKLFSSYDEFKKEYKKNGCQFVIAQFEEDWPPDKTMNYQFINALTDFTKEEIKEFTAKTHRRITNLAKDPATMLGALKANENSFLKDKIALSIYPELLRDGYSRAQLKDLKKRMLLDAKSGTIKCKNKRLYVVPDWYAACEHWFCGIENPIGLLAKDEVACSVYRKDYEKADVLRSPSLYMEHNIVRISKDPKIYKWLNSDGIYTSVKSLISRVLQFDQRSN